MNLPYKDSLLSLLPSNSIYHFNKRETDTKNLVTVNSVLDGNIKTHGEKVYIFDSWIGKAISLSLTGPSILNSLKLLGYGGGASLKMPGGCVWQQYTLSHHNIVTCHGWTDYLVQKHQEPTATIFNTSWSVFLSKTGILKEDLWQDACEVQNLLSAELFLLGVPVTEQIRIISALVGAACGGDNEQENWKSHLQKWKSGPRMSLAAAMFNCEVKNIILMQELIFLESFKQYLFKTADDLEGTSLIPLFEYFVKRKNMNLIFRAQIMSYI